MMTSPHNKDHEACLKFGQLVPDWCVPPSPADTPIEGRYCTLEPLDVSRHGKELFAANTSGEDADRIWDYLPYGPFRDEESYLDWLRQQETSQDPRFYAIRENRNGKLAGLETLMSIKPEAGSIELGHICIAPHAQRSRVSTEAFMLAIRTGFELGYRRFEWKCNALNLPSRRAAQRLGLSYEGVFRNAGVVKGRNRDTAWFAAIDTEWPALEKAYDAWLSEENFDEHGKQNQSLAALTQPILVKRDPAL